MRRPHGKNQGFTLIELSIVFVIIGLIVGGVLVGQELISAGQARAQISQLDKYNTAVNTFVLKFGYLPGDIPDPAASSFGFQARGQYAGEGDGNGIIEGVSADSPGSNVPQGSETGETVMFWADLSTAKMIDGSFTVASPHVLPGWSIWVTGTPTVLGQFLPQAKIGNGNYIYAFSGKMYINHAWIPTGVNWLAVENITALNPSGPQVTPNLSVKQVYAIDTKIDDGIPTTGRVQAFYVNFVNSWYDWSNGNVDTGPSDTSATTGSTTTCYDNAGVAGATEQYSMEISNGSNPNCALSFKMQGAAR